MTEESNSSLGIIGFGQFGRFMASHLAPYFEVLVCDAVDRSEDAANVGAQWANFEVVVSQPIVVFAVPLVNLEAVLSRAVPFLRDRALCLDVCSVKIAPLELMRRTLPQNVDIVGTHPLFGPQSGREGIEGLRVAVCEVRGNRLPHVAEFLESALKLRVLKKTADEHDREMAHVQALTHFVARALDELHVVDSDLATVSYEEIMKAARLVSEDSWELFRTIENANPFAAEKRRAFVDKLIELEKRVAG